jgi:hypothetical protein
MASTRLPPSGSNECHSLSSESRQCCHRKLLRPRKYRRRASDSSAGRPKVTLGGNCETSRRVRCQRLCQDGEIWPPLYSDLRNRRPINATGLGVYNGSPQTIAVRLTAPEIHENVVPCEVRPWPPEFLTRDAVENSPALAIADYGFEFAFLGRFPERARPVFP